MKASFLVMFEQRASILMTESPVSHPHTLRRYFCFLEGEENDVLAVLFFSAAAAFARARFSAMRSSFVLVSDDETLTDFLSLCWRNSKSSLRFGFRYSSWHQGFSVKSKLVKFFNFPMARKENCCYLRFTFLVYEMYNSVEMRGCSNVDQVREERPVFLSQGKLP